MKQNKPNYLWLDLLRGVAALMVVVGHTRGLLFFDYQGSEGALAKAFYFLTGFAHQSVIIFFVLSGFFIIKSIHESYLNGKWNFKQYFLNRLTRLWVPLIPALLFTLLIDTIGITYFNDSYTYRGTVEHLPGIVPHAHMDIRTFFGNMFFLQNIFCNTFGSNGALWSLTNEFWYYVIFPFTYFIIVSFYKPLIKLLLAIALAVITFYIEKGILLYGIVWLMGGLSYIIIERKLISVRHSGIIVLATTLLFFITLAIVRSGKLSFVFNDFSLGFVTAVFVAALSQVDMKSSALKKVATFLSNVSYTVYLVHLSFAVLLASIVFTDRNYFSASMFIKYIAFLLVVFIYAVCMYQLFERNTAKVKNWVSKFV